MNYYFQLAHVRMVSLTPKKTAVLVEALGIAQENLKTMKAVIPNANRILVMLACYFEEDTFNMAHARKG